MRRGKLLRAYSMDLVLGIGESQGLGGRKGLLQVGVI